MDENIHNNSDNKNIIARVVLTSVLVTLGVVFVFGVFAFQYRAQIFETFATGYIKDTKENAGVGYATKNVFDQESAIVGIAQQASPAVVSIVVTKDVPVVEPFFQEFGPFGFQVPQFRQKGTEEQEISGGSGFIVSRDGLMVTNKHVVADEDARFTVLTNDGESFDAEVVARDPLMDIALLKIKGEGQQFAHLEFGDSDVLDIGQTAIAIGNALGEFRNSVSVGVVSGLSRSIVAGNQFGGSPELLDEVIQTDAAINPGNSGGPLLDINGRVIGVNVAVALGSQSIGFALPANTIKAAVDSVRLHGEIIRPYLGVRYITITDKIREENDLSVNEGALVAEEESLAEPSVISDSPADKAGILPGDIILEVDGEGVTQEKQLASIIRKKAVGDTVNVGILRSGKRLNLSVLLEKIPLD